MADLQKTIAALAQSFAEGVLRAVRDASLEEVAALGTGGRARAARSAPREAEPAAAKKGRRAAGLARTRPGARRSPEDFQRIVDAIVETLAKHPEGLRSEELQRELGLSKSEMPRPLKHALEAKVVRKKGQKRSTRYFAR